MAGKALCLSVEDFQTTILLKPPPHLMPPHTKIESISNALGGMVDGFAERAYVNMRVAEDVLAEEFSKIIEDQVFKHVAGMPTKASAMPGLSVANSSSIAVPWGPPNLVDVVPWYIMRDSPYESLETDSAPVDAAIFLEGASIRSSRPRWVHQRMCVMFKEADGQNDPFDDDVMEDVESQDIERERVLRQLVTYIFRIFYDQHRTAVFSMFIIGSEFRFIFSDQSRMIVTEKINYVTHTRTLLELLLGFLVLDDSAQGFDTTATLLAEDSNDYKLMDSIAEGYLRVPVLPFQEGTVLPSDIPVEVVTTYPVADVQASKSSGPSVHPGVRDSPDMNIDEPATSERDTSGVKVIVPKDGSYVFQYELSSFAKSLKDWPRYKLTIGEETFMVGKPTSFEHGALGPMTRSYVAYRPLSGCFVFLKDKWCGCYDSIKCEGDTLAELNEKHVSNVPTLVCHGNVDNQTTRVSDYWLKFGTKPERIATLGTNGDGDSALRGVNETVCEPRREELPYLCSSTHSRIVMREVCLPLATFQSGYQLVSVLSDIVDAHCEAVVKCSMLHHNISSNNVLILPTFVKSEDPRDDTLHVKWRGMLAEWELSTRVSNDGKDDDRARQPETRGTFGFISVASLLHPFHVVGIADELESIYDVLLHSAVRYLPNSLDGRAKCFVKEYFGDELCDINGINCSALRTWSITKGTLVHREERILFRTATGKAYDALNSLLYTLLNAFRARYEVEGYEKAIANNGSLDLADTAPSTEPDVVCGVAMARPCSAPQEPSESTRMVARLLGDYTFVKALFHKALFYKALPEWKWPECDSVVDNFASGPPTPIEYAGTVVELDANGNPIGPGKLYPMPGAYLAHAPTDSQDSDGVRYGVLLRR